jgi:hypothetical protein
MNDAKQKSVERNEIPPFSTAQLLIAPGLLFIAAPFVEKIETGKLIICGLFSLVVLAGLLLLQIANACWSSKSYLPFPRSPADGLTAARGLLADRTNSQLVA